MPINEAVTPYQTLPPQQRQQQVESLYGPQPPNELPLNLSIEQQQALRQYLDSQIQQEGRKEFDLAAPKVPQYRYSEFPFLLYDHTNHRTKSVKNHGEREQAMAQGWSDQPFQSEEAPDLPILAADIQEAQRMDMILKMPKEDLEKLLASVSGEPQPQPDNKKRK